MTRPFPVDPGLATLLGDFRIRPAELLRRAGLPEDLLTRKRPTLQTDGFLRLWDELTKSLPDKAPGLILAQSRNPEAFSPEHLAVCCSPNLTEAANRLSRYKSLVSPVQLEVHDTLGGLEITYSATSHIQLPVEFIAGTLSSLVVLARLASKREVRPIAVEMVQPPVSDAYGGYFGRTIRKGPFNRVVFTREDSRSSFVPPDPGLFTVFDPDLQTRPDQLSRDATLKDRVRAILMEALPGGQAETALVAARLGISPRGLQRKLAAEKTSFQSELRDLRRRLAEGYLSRTALGSPEIAFLLGYDDPNSFIRAFHTWSGTTPEAYRSAAHRT